MTKVIELYGAPGSGKSTYAAQLFVTLKKQGYKVELALESVKDWIYDGRQVDLTNELWFLGEQFRRESILYGKVDFIITDAPMLLHAFYADKFSSLEFGAFVNQYITSIRAKFGVSVDSILLKREGFRFQPEGRIHSEQEADAIQNELQQYLGRFVTLTSSEEGFTL